jgi:hypothetical protein
MSNVEVGGLQAVIEALHFTVQGMAEQAVAAGEEIAQILKEYAKANHPWQNVSGETEATTGAQVAEATAEMVIIALFSQTPQAVFLELSIDGKWSWLFPAILANEHAVMEILEKYLQQVKQRF